MLYVSTGEGHESNNAQSTELAARQDPAPGPAQRAGRGRQPVRQRHRGPTACATRGGSRSTAGPATSRSATSARTRREEVDWGAAARAGTWRELRVARHARGAGRRRSSRTRTATASARSSAATSCATPACRRLRGRYLYGDNCQSSLYTTTPRTGADDERRPGLTVSALTSFGEDACGHVYAASLNGPVYRLQDGAVSPCSLTGSRRIRRRRGWPSGVAGVRKLLKKRVLRIGVRCSEACQVAVGTRLRNVRRLATRHRNLTANQRKVVRVKLSKALTKKLRKRVRRRGFVRIAVTVRATDAAGNVATRRRAAGSSAGASYSSSSPGRRRAARPCTRRGRRPSRPRC